MKAVYVRDYMATNLVTLTPEMEILRAVHLLLEHEFGGAPVVDNIGNLVGILTEKDCMKVVLNAGYHSEYGGRVAEFMSHDIKTMTAAGVCIVFHVAHVVGDATVEVES